jgi:predicted DNA-binding transcriptional regulator YafY
MKNSVQRTQRLHIIYNFLLKKGKEDKQSASQILDYLNKTLDQKYTKRTIERDLVLMTSEFRIQSEGEYPILWWADKIYTPNVQIKISQKEIETIIIALESLKMSAPNSIEVDCEEAIHALLDNFVADYAEKLNDIRSRFKFSHSILGKAVPKDDKAVDLALMALQRNVFFTCYYTNRDGMRKKRLLAGVVFLLTAGIPHMYVFDPKKNKYYSINLCRLEDVKLTDRKYVKPKDLELENINYSIGGFGVNHANIIDFEIICSGELLKYFEIRQIHESQTIQSFDQTRKIVRFKMADSQEIARFLAGYFSDIDQILPLSVENKIRNFIGLKESVS